MKRSAAKPFLKWTGGKRWLVPKINDHLPVPFRTYYEPFLGGGALFFALNPNDAILSDINEELINAYIQVRDSVLLVVATLRDFSYDRKTYLKIRSWVPSTDLERAVRFIYLNRTCWNGLYRENKHGKFNVPFGRYSNPTICDEQNLVRVSHLLRSKRIVHGDFADVVKTAHKGDFVYFDPPYASRARSRFVRYNAGAFSWSDQSRLAEVAFDLQRRGCFVMITNADDGQIRNLYRGFYVKRITRQGLLAARGEARAQVQELLIRNFRT
jgi:DNA adenine methylase